MRRTGTEEQERAVRADPGAEGTGHRPALVPGQKAPEGLTAGGRGSPTPGAPRASRWSWTGGRTGTRPAEGREWPPVWTRRSPTARARAVPGSGGPVGKARPPPRVTGTAEARGCGTRPGPQGGEGTGLGRARLAEESQGPPHTPSFPGLPRTQAEPSACGEARGLRAVL